MNEENFYLQLLMGGVGVVVYKSRMKILLHSCNYLLPLWHCCYKHNKLIPEYLWICLTLILIVMQIKSHRRIMFKLKMYMAYLVGEALKMAMISDSEILSLSAEPLPGVPGILF